MRVIFSENSGLGLALVISGIRQTRSFILAEGVSAVDVMLFHYLGLKVWS